MRYRLIFQIQLREGKIAMVLHMETKWGDLTAKRFGELRKDDAMSKRRRCCRMKRKVYNMQSIF